MKNSLLAFFGLFVFTTLWSQNYDPVKTLVMLNQLEKAKTDLDKSFTNAKFTAKPEAFILKTSVYAGVSVLEGKKDTPLGLQLIEEADAAFSKYKEMDPNLSLIGEPIYQNGIITLYSNYYTFGFNDYNNNNTRKVLAS